MLEYIINLEPLPWVGLQETLDKLLGCTWGESDGGIQWITLTNTMKRQK